MHSWKDKQKWLPIVILIAIVCLAAVFRLINLDARTMGHIEIYVPNIDLPEGISDPPPRFTIWKTITGSMWDAHPPTWYISMWPWTKLFGSDLFTIRFPSVLFGVASILLIYLLGILEGDKLTALLAAGLLALNGHHILWSQAARPYSMACFLGLLSTALLLLTWRGGPRKHVFLLFYLLISAMGLAMVYYFWPIFATHILWVLFNSFQKKTRLLGLIRSQILILIVCSPLVALAIFQSRLSYLDSDILSFFKDFIQFGFLFEPDIDALIQNPLPLIIKVSFPFFASLLLIRGFMIKRRDVREINITDINGPSIKQLAVVATLAFVLIIFAAWIFHHYQPNKTVKILVSGFMPLLFLLLAFLLHRHSAYIDKIGGFLNQGKFFRENSWSLISFLTIVPMIIIAGITLFMPFLASRNMLLYTPFLLIVLSRGIASIIRGNRRWYSFSLFVALLMFLAPIHYSSILYHRHRPNSPHDYKRLAQQWIPHIKNSDIIFVQQGILTTPIFYYLKGDSYQFVGSGYSRELQKHPGSRAWVLTFQGLPIPEELKDALSNYVSLMSLNAKRIKTELYVQK